MTPTSIYSFFEGLEIQYTSTNAETTGNICMTNTNE